MKKLLFISLAVVAASCGSKTTGDYLTELNVTRDSIKTEYRELGTALAKIEAEIVALDTTRKVVNVTATSPNRTAFLHFFKIYGSIQTDNNTLVFPSSQGEIMKLNVEEGQPVSKGQVLLSIDSEIIMKNMDELNVQIELAQDVFNKQDKLWKQNIGSEMDYLQAKNNLDALNSKMETLKTQKSKTNVKAPFSGVIDEIMVKTGQLVTPGVATMRIVNLDEVYLKADVPEGYIKTIGKGTPVNVNFPSIDESVVTHINETGRFINPANRTFTARINLENQNNRLYPNLLGMLEIQDYANDSALVIPARLIQENAQGESYIFTVKLDNNARYSILQPIEVGMTYNGLTEVLSGLNDTDLIIDKGSRNVSNNQLIRVTK